MGFGLKQFVTYSGQILVKEPKDSLKTQINPKAPKESAGICSNPQEPAGTPRNAKEPKRINDQGFILR